MKKFFNSIRWIFVALLIIPTFIVIIGGGAITSVSQVLTNPENPKAWLQESDTYEKAVSVGAEEIIKRAKASQDKESLEDITNGLLNKQEAKQLAQEIFPSQWIKNQTETAIDSFYLFLNNEEESFSFDINTKEINESAKDKLSTLFLERAQDLPECSSNNQITIDEFNILEADCLPSSISPSQIESRIESEINEVPFFQKGEVNSQELGVEIKEGENIKRIFKFLKGSPLIILLATLILTFLIFITTPKFKNKLKTVGFTWSTGGFMLIVISLLIKTTFSSFFVDLIINNLLQENAAIINFVKSPLDSALAGITNYILILGVVVLIIGIITAFSSRLSSNDK